ncbi:MAG: hypothetical protein LQ348_005966 [Seirophora lacunosa]|nr:MAG: hypothetical protein LQ344_005537 [Seirophora lacunosa]KAI4176545.1 MAG: hypothetical protein LQ348_005966 [Seirophora lacunosa]
MTTLTPAIPPPSGIQSNFEDPPGRCYLTVIPCAAIVGVMIIFVFVRMYTKVYILKSIGWDDYTCMFAAVSSVVYLGFLMALYALGFGVHEWDITYHNLESLLSKEGKTLSALWGPTMFFTKLSLLLLYHRIFAPDRVTKYLVYFGILYCFVLYTSFLLLTFLLCQSTLEGSCEREMDLFVLISRGFNVLADIYLLIIPIAAVAKLHMPLRQKVGVSAVFFAGMLACLSGILALYYRTQLLSTRDITWHSTPVFIFTVLEINTGIIVSCMPTMPALIHDTRSQISASRNPRSRRGRGHRHRSGRSATRSCQQKEDGGKKPAPPSQRHVRFEAPQPVELDSTPALRRMEEARVRVLRGPAVSFFSDDSSDADVGGDEEDLGWLS